MIGDDQISKFHIFRQGTSSAAQAVYTTKAATPAKWDEFSLKTQSLVADNPYWAKVVTLNDRLVILVGGTSDPKALFDMKFKAPCYNESLIGLGNDTSIYLQNPVDKSFTIHPACAFHKPTMTLYIIGGVKNGSWTNQITKYNLITGIKSNDIDQLPEALIGPSAIVVSQSEEKNKIPVLYVSG